MLEGKRVILVEDSIVRSTTMKVLISNRIRELGLADEIHVRVACPPIIAPCFYGIDMSTIGELFAPQFMQDDRSTEAAYSRDGHDAGRRFAPLSAGRIDRPGDRLRPTDQLCQACITGQYPTPHGQKLYQIALRNSCEAAEDGSASLEGSRTYEVPGARA